MTISSFVTRCEYRKQSLFASVLLLFALSVSEARPSETVTLSWVTYNDKTFSDTPAKHKVISQGHRFKTQPDDYLDLGVDHTFADFSATLHGAVMERLLEKKTPTLLLLLSGHGYRAYLMHQNERKIPYRKILIEIIKLHEELEKRGKTLTTNVVLKSCYSGKFIESAVETLSGSNGKYFHKNDLFRFRIRMNVITSTDSVCSSRECRETDIHQSLLAIQALEKKLGLGENAYSLDVNVADGSPLARKTYFGESEKSKNDVVNWVHFFSTYQEFRPPFIFSQSDFLEIQASKNFNHERLPLYYRALVTQPELASLYQDFLVSAADQEGWNAKEAFEVIMALLKKKEAIVPLLELYLKKRWSSGARFGVALGTPLSDDVKTYLRETSAFDEKNRITRLIESTALGDRWSRMLAWYRCQIVKPYLEEAELKLLNDRAYHHILYGISDTSEERAVILDFVRAASRERASEK